MFSANTRNKDNTQKKLGRNHAHLLAVVIVESRVFVQHYQKYTFGKYVFPSRECHTLFLKM